METLFFYKNLAYTYSMITHLGNWTIALIDRVLQEAAAITGSGDRIDYISSQLLNTPYKESSLIGSITVPEDLVIDLDGMDCMTFIEYVDAMRLSGTYAEFTINLRRIRYKKGIVAYESRRHFFTDWIGNTPQTVEDVTTIVGAGKTLKVKKRLNLNSNGTFILPGICITEREVSCIPVDAIDNIVIEQIKTGDYAGIYSDKDGLDVSHTGIIIKDEHEVYLRHASSRKDTYKIVDEILIKYLAGKNGLIILRAI